MPTVTVDEQTARALEFAAKMANTSPGEVIARLVREGSVPVQVNDPTPTVAIFGVYEGHRTTAVFDRTTSRVDITGGPLAGTSYKSPTGAARAIVVHYKPDVSPHRNGWYFWILDDGTNRPLQDIRH